MGHAAPVGPYLLGAGRGDPPRIALLDPATGNQIGDIGQWQVSTPARDGPMLGLQMEPGTGRAWIARLDFDGLSTEVLGIATGVSTCEASTHAVVCRHTKTEPSGSGRHRTSCTASIRGWLIVATVRWGVAWRVDKLVRESASLFDRFRRDGVAADLERAVELARQAVGAARAGVEHADAAVFLSRVSFAAYRHTRHGPALDEAEAAARAAVTAAGSDGGRLAVCLAQLATVLRGRFEEQDVAAVLDEAIANGRHAAEIATVDHPEYAGIQFDICALLFTRAKRTGSSADLEETAAAGFAALAHVEPVDPLRVNVLSLLGAVHELKYEFGGRDADLDRAVELGRAAVDATPADRLRRPVALSNLSCALRVRFVHTGRMSDIDEAVAVAREALALTAADDGALSGRLSNLGSALKVRFNRTGVRSDIDEAIEVHRAAVAKTSAGPALVLRLSNLGNALEVRYHHTGDRQDIQSAVEAGRRALARAPATDPRRPRYAANLAQLLVSLFQRTGELASLDEAIGIGREAVAATPADFPDRALRLLNRGRALYLRSQDDRDPRLRREARLAFAESAENERAAPRVRAEAARWIARLAAEDGDWAMASQALDDVLAILPTLVDGRLSRADQEYHLSLLDQLGPEAAAAALMLGDWEKAWLVLEQGRGVLHAQTLHSHADEERLRQADPALADEVSRLRLLLDTDRPSS